MRMILELDEANERLSGTVRRADADSADDKRGQVRFEGAIALLGALDRLRVGGDPGPA